MKVAVLGAGAWGTALAINAGAHHAVTLWARDVPQAQVMQAQRVNTRYLPEQAFTDGVQVSSAPFGAWLAEQDLVVIGSPMSGLRGMLTQLAPILGSHFLWHGCAKALKQRKLTLCKATPRTAALV